MAGARDVITDMVRDVDMIDLSALDANTIAGGNQVFAYAGNTAFTNVAGQLIYSAATGLLQGDTNGDGTADFVMFIQSHAVLGASDFLL